MTYEKAIEQLHIISIIAGTLTTIRPIDAEAARMGMKALEKQIPTPPIPDKNSIGIDGKPVPRCYVCGYALDLRMEQYCPNCGQRLTRYSESEVNK